MLYNLLQRQFWLFSSVVGWYLYNEISSLAKHQTDFTLEYTHTSGSNLLLVLVLHMLYNLLLQRFWLFSSVIGWYLYKIKYYFWLSIELISHSNICTLPGVVYY